MEVSRTWLDNPNEAMLSPQQEQQSDISSQFNNTFVHPAEARTMRPTGTQLKLLYSKPETASLLSLSVRKIDDLIAMKELPVCRVGRRVLVTHQALLQFIRKDHR